MGMTLSERIKKAQERKAATVTVVPDPTPECACGCGLKRTSA